MVDFATPVPTYSTKRPYEPISSFSDFCDVKDEFLNDTTMGLTEKTLKSETYITVINMTKNGEVVAKIRVETSDEDGYDTLLARINDEIAEEAFGANAVAAEDPDKRNWKLNFSGTAATGDEFKLLVDESYAQLSGYHETSTLTTVETWADTIEVLSNEPEA